MSSQFINSKLKQSFLERILRSISINVFCDDPSKITKLNENWSLVDRATNWHQSSLLLWLIFVNFCSTSTFSKYTHHCVWSVLVTLIPQRSHIASQWLNTNWLDVLDFWGYPNPVLVCWPTCLRQLLTALHSFKIF